MPAPPSPRRARPEGWAVPVAVGIGASIGLISGLMIDQPALGLAVGAGFGVVGGAGATTARDVPGPRRRGVVASAIAVAAAGAAVVLLIWLASAAEAGVELVRYGCTLATGRLHVVSGAVRPRPRPPSRRRTGVGRTGCASR